VDSDKKRYSEKQTRDTEGEEMQHPLQLEDVVFVKETSDHVKRENPNF
jgi:hypothetical protein